MPQNTDIPKIFESTQRFLKPMKYNKKDTLLLCLYFAVEGGFWVVFVFFVKQLVEALELLNINLFNLILFQYSLIFIVWFLALFLFRNGWTTTYNRYRESIEEEYLPKYVRFDNNTHEVIGTWKSIAIISKWVKTWGSLLDNLLVTLVNLVLSVSLTIYLLIEIHYALSIFLIVILILWQIVGIFLNNKVLEKRKKRIELDNLWSKQVVKIIMSKMEILQSKNISNEVKKLHELHEGQIYYNKAMTPYMVPFFSLGIIVIIVLLYVIFVFLGYQYFNGQVSLSLVAALSWAILMMQKVFMSTLDFLKNFTKEFAEVRNMWDFFDYTPQIQGYDTWSNFKHISWDISLTDISYWYDKNRKIFYNFSLGITGNKITALVWPSGGWKSTLVKLISGYIRQDSWNIFIDNQNLKDISLESYYRDVWYLTQEPSVFDGTVLENLLYAVEKEPTKKQIEKIIELAHCEFIYDLPKGLKTEIWERWVKLSGWQKQRLAIAKIFLKDPKIIILDEPTSALDSLSEQKITEAMHNLFTGRTVLIIAHRLQTVKHADDIIVIENGSIIERWTHSSLIRKKGYYKQMLDLQSGF